MAAFSLAVELFGITLSINAVPTQLVDEEEQESNTSLGFTTAHSDNNPLPFGFSPVPFYWEEEE